MIGRDNETVEEILREQRRLRDRILHVTASGAAPDDDAALVRAAVQDLADLAAAAEGRAVMPVPELAGRMLADQLTVMINDCVHVGDAEMLAVVLGRLVALRRAL